MGQGGMKETILDRKRPKPCLLAVSMGKGNPYGSTNRAFFGSPYWGSINMARCSMPSQVPHSGKESIWLNDPCFLGVPTLRRNRYGCRNPALGLAWWGGSNVALSSHLDSFSLWGPLEGRVCASIFIRPQYRDPEKVALTLPQGFLFTMETMRRPRPSSQIYPSTPWQP